MGRTGGDYGELLRGGKLEHGEVGTDNMFATPRGEFWYEWDKIWYGMPPQAPRSGKGHGRGAGLDS